MALLVWSKPDSSPHLKLDGRAFDGQVPLLEGEPGRLDRIRKDIEDGILDVPGALRGDDA